MTAPLFHPDDLADQHRHDIGEPATPEETARFLAILSVFAAIGVLLIAIGANGLMRAGAMPAGCQTVECAAEGGL